MIFIGDIHGQFQIFLDLLKSKKYQSKTLIQVGDFGVGFYPLDQEYNSLNKINSYLVKNNNFLYVIRGNHDNPKYFTESPFQLSNIQFLNDFEDWATMLYACREHPHIQTEYQKLMILVKLLT